MRSRDSISGDDDGGHPKGTLGLPELGAAVVALQRLLSMRAVAEAIGIEGCGDAVRLVQQVLSQVGMLGGGLASTASCLGTSVCPCMAVASASLQQQAWIGHRTWCACMPSHTSRLADAGDTYARVAELSTSAVL